MSMNYIPVEIIPDYQKTLCLGTFQKCLHKNTLSLKKRKKKQAKWKGSPLKNGPWAPIIFENKIIKQ